MNIAKRVAYSILLFMFVLVVLQACAIADTGKNPTGVAGDPHLIEKARNVTVGYKLTDIPLACLNFEVAEAKFDGKVMVIAREIHGGDCGGDPDTSPRLFSLAFDDETGEIWSDARSLLGQMELITE